MYNMKIIGFFSIFYNSSFPSCQIIAKLVRYKKKRDIPLFINKEELTSPIYSFLDDSTFYYIFHSCLCFFYGLLFISYLLYLLISVFLLLQLFFNIETTFLLFFLESFFTKFFFSTRCSCSIFFNCFLEIRFAFNNSSFKDIEKSFCYYP